MSIERSPLSRRHRIALAVILLVGVATGAAIWRSGTPTNAESAEHSHHGAPGESAGHKEHGDHGDHDEDHAAKPAGERHDDEGEGLIALDEAQLKAAGVQLAQAGPAPIAAVLELPGEIRLNEDRTAHVVPRVAGVAERVAVTLGERVRQGQVLAVIASPAASELRSELQTLQRRLALARTQHERERKLWEDKISAEQDYQQARQQLAEAETAVANVQHKLAALGIGTAEGAALSQVTLRAPFDGLVIEKHLSLGEAVKDDAPVFTVSDLSTVWAEVALPAQDLDRVRVGDAVSVQSTASATRVTGRVAFVGALIGEQTRSATVRVRLPNPQGAWRPGLFVTVAVSSGDAAAPAPVTVTADAVQTVEDKPTVFVQVPGGFRAQPVQLGRSDGQRVEVRQGLKAGTAYAASGSFVLKSELGKATAEHSH